ncbi:MAG: tetratricopeptide repeat protein [Brevundimonas sp.]
MVDVFEEVEEELRSERYRRLFRTWWPWVAGALVLALVAALAWWGWQSWQTSRAETAAAHYDRGMQALSEENIDAAEAAFVEAVDVGSGGYKALALHQRAGIAVAQDRIEDAVALFDEAASASRQPLIADLARLKAAFLLMDTASLEDIEARLAPIAEDGRPFSPYAREAQGLARIQHGQTAQARPVFALLALGQDVPDVVRQRAQLVQDAIDSGVAASMAEIVRAQAEAPQPEAAMTPTQTPAGVAPAAQP